MSESNVITKVRHMNELIKYRVTATTGQTGQKTFTTRKKASTLNCQNKR